VSARKGFCKPKSSKENAKIFKECLLNSIGRPGCTQEKTTLILIESRGLKAYNSGMRENGQFIAEGFTRKIDRWLRKEDTWLAKGLRRINSLEGTEYRVSKTKRMTDLAIALPTTAFASIPTGIFLGTVNIFLSTT